MSLPFAAFLLAVLTPVSGSIQVTPTVLKPGDPVVVSVFSDGGVPEGTFAERPLQFFAVQGGWEAVTGLPVETEPGEVAVRVAVPRSDDGGTETIEGTIAVRDPEYPARELTVAKEFVEPPPEVKKQIKADQAAFQEAYAQPFGPRAFQGAFVRPRESKVTAPYGDRRTFNDKQQSQHYGLDLDGRVGDPIRAAHAGTVVLVRDCYASGKTVLVHHGAGLFTAYFHLSKFEVKQGDSVKQGQRLGAVGRTGRVTGPHLHWAVKVDGLYVDPMTLLGLPFEAPVTAVRP